MRYLVAVAVVLAVPGVLYGQHQQGAAANVARADSLTASHEALGAVRERLRELVAAQEAYFVDHQSYTTDLSALELRPRGTGRAQQVVLNVTHAGGRAWRATGRHAGHLHRSCVIFVGDVNDFPLPVTRADGRRPTAAQEGEPVCDKP